MRKILLGLAVLALGACGQGQDAPPAEAARAITDPAAIVRQIYEPYLDAEARPRALLDAAPWSQRLRAEIESMQSRAAEIEEPILNFDPLIDAQDWQLRDVSAATESVVEASHATVRASFTNVGHAQEVVYDLIWEGDRWRVDNVRGADWDLRTIVTTPIEPIAPAAP